MIERIIILENIDPIVFYGINNCNIQLIKTLFPKLRFTARGLVIKVIGDENETAIFESKIKQLESEKDTAGSSKKAEIHTSLQEDA